MKQKKSTITKIALFAVLFGISSVTYAQNYSPYTNVLSSGGYQNSNRGSFLVPTNPNDPRASIYLPPAPQQRQRVLVFPPAPQINNAPDFTVVPAMQQPRMPMYQQQYRPPCGCR